MSNDKKISELTKGDLKEIFSSLGDKISWKIFIFGVVAMICLTILLKDAKSFEGKIGDYHFKLNNALNEANKKIYHLENNVAALSTAIQSDPKLKAKLQHDMNKSLNWYSGIYGTGSTGLIETKDSDDVLRRQEPASVKDR